MTEISEIVDKYFESGDVASEKSITKITKIRNYSVACKAEFFECVVQIKKRLKSSNCKEVARAFLILQLICPLAGEDTLNFQLQISKNKDFKDYFIHGIEVESCTWCDIVKHGADYLKKVLAKLLLSLHCGKCDTLPSSAIKLDCKHNLCKNCWMKAKVDLNKKKYRTVTCVFDGKDTPKEFILRINSEDFVNYKFESSEKNDTDTKTEVARSSSRVEIPQSECSSFSKVDCPNCKKSLLISKMEAQVPICSHCEFCFCIFCRKSYHGITACTVGFGDEDKQDESKSSKEHNVTSSKRSSSPIKSTAFGAVAHEFETNYYSDPLLDAFTTDEVNDAFDNPIVLTEIEWPWEFPTASSLYNCPKKFESLKPGNWVEDEILEKVVKIMIGKNKLENEFAFLESYVVKFAASKNSTELERVLLEKKILVKNIVLVLINTDFSGHGGHWVLGILHYARKRIVLIDSSLVISPTFYRRSFFALLNLLHVAHHLEETRFIPHEWQLIVLLDGVQQQNAFDCGPLAVCNAVAVMERRRLTRLPKSVMLREWLLKVLQENDKPDKNFNSDENPNAREKQLGKLEPFSATGLKIEFKLFQDI